ncbi:MAG TPA: hypothetical protein VFX58_13145 [Chitinophagaceae bacterium]|nr:hypothetical protein [Chitinophagaceae bacterium]
MRLALFMLITALLHVTCTFRVVSPKAFQSSSQDFDASDGFITITVTFNEDVDKNTVVIGKTFILVTEKVPNAPGAFIPTPDPRKLIFKTTSKVSDLLTFDPDGFFSLKMIGSDTGDGAIKTVNGRHLDGDGNNTNGGDYSTSFVIVG